jgi:cytochrome c-type biogenesis protein
LTTALVLHADPVGLLIAFGAGMLSFVSPCVLPMVPGYISMVSGLSAAQLGLVRPVPVLVGGPAVGVAEDVLEASATESTLRAHGALFKAVLLFIAGFTVVFTALGASASALGHLLLKHVFELRTISAVLIVVFGAVLIAMATGIRLPAVIMGERRLHVRPSVLGAWAPLAMGAAFSFAWTPCVSPVLGSVLSLAAGSGGSASGGVVLLLAYSLGLGVPFLLFGLAFGTMTDLAARFRGALRYVDFVGGAILIVFGLILLTGNIAVLSVHISNWLNDLHINWISKI